MDSLLGLQSEIMRKKNETTGSSMTQKLNLKLNSRDQLKLNHSSTKSGPDDRDDEKELERSRKMMEAKSNFYERMQSGKGIGSDGSKRYLIDFEKKILDDPEKIEKIKCESGNSLANQTEEVFAPVHYQHLRENEARELGVGYFEFSLDEETRNTQLETLKEMHRETKGKQHEKEYNEKLRQIAIKERLNKIRAKRNLPIDNSVVELPSKDANLDSEDNNTATELKVLRAENRAEALVSNREWDNRKRTLNEVIDEKVKKARDERDPEFAPPDSYQEAPSSNSSKASAHTIRNIPGTGSFVSSSGNAMKALEEMYDNGPKNIKSGLGLPREGDIAGLVIGDSIQKRVLAENISDHVFVRGFGGAKAKDICERLSYNTIRKIKHIIFTIGTNDALSCNSDDLEFRINFKKCIELIHQKFTPDILQIGTLTPTRGQLSHVNFYVDRINNLIRELFNEFEFPGMNIQLLDVNAAFQLAISPISPDGLHPSTEGVMVLVQCYRQQFETSDISINWDQEVKMRPPPNYDRKKKDHF